MKKCEDIQNSLIHFLNHELAPEQMEPFEEHLKWCRECGKEKESLEQVSDTLAMLEDHEVPLALRHRTLQLIESANVKETGRLKRKAKVLGLGKILLAVGIGVLQVLLFGQLSGIFMAHQAMPAFNMVTACILWCGLIIIASLVVLEDYQLNRRKLRWAVSTALIALATVALVPFLLSPKPLYYLWETSILGRQLASYFGNGGSMFTFGILYGLIPMSMVAFALGRKMQGRILENAFLSSVFFLILISPAIYLQSYTLFIHSSVMLISWASGTLLGAFGGVFGILKLSHL